MSIQIKPSVTNLTIAKLYQNIKARKLILKPDFQRKFVWTHDHQQEFIDTILNGYPFPEIYVCQDDTDIKKPRTAQHVIDGQQRLSTINKYIDGEHDRPLTKIPKYEDMNEEQKRNFLCYQVVVRDIGRVRDESVREIFRRINLTKFKPEDVEIHNAVYDGHFIRTARSILEDVDLEEYGIFHESGFTRMADLHFILLVMATIENEGYFPQDEEVERLIAEYNDEYPNRDRMKTLLTETYDVISDLRLPPNSLWLRQSNFYTLVVEVSKNISAIPDDIISRLERTEKDIMKNRDNKESEFGQYYSCMYSETTSRKARVVRAEIFDKYMFG